MEKSLQNHHEKHKSILKISLKKQINGIEMHSQGKTMTFKNKSFTLLLLLPLLISGCATNPVTGKNELMLSSQEEDVRMGNHYYRPAIQAQGGLYKLDKSVSQYVRRVGHKLAAVSDTPNLPFEFNVINSSIPNAWAMPGGKITINRGLLEELNDEAELAAVLGHEIVHASARHSAKRMQQSLLVQSIFIIADVASGSGGQLNDLGSNINTLIGQQYSQSQELESDKYGMLYLSRAGYDPNAAVDLQATFIRLSKDKKSDWFSGLFASHPPSEKRLEANKATAMTLPSSSYRGKSNFNKHMKKIMLSKHAYRAYDKGVELYLKNKKNIEVLRQAQKAIQLEPKEAIFYALLGDYYFATGQYPFAIKQYNTAISLDNDYYYYFLRRGQAYKRLNEPQKAKSDLQRSQQILHNKKG